MMTCFHRAVIFILFFSLPYAASGSQHSASIELTSASTILFDPESSLTLKEINTQEYYYRFSPWENTHFRFLTRKGTAWVKVQLPEPEQLPEKALLKMISQAGSSIEAYLVENNTPVRLEAAIGSNALLFNLFSRKITDQPVLLIKLPAKSAHYLSMSIVTPEQALKEQSLSDQQSSMLLIAFLLIALLNLSQWLRYKSSTHAYLAAACFCCLVFLLSWTGLFHIHYWTQYNDLRFLIMNLAVLFGALITAQGSRHFLAEGSTKRSTFFHALSLLPSINIALILLDVDISFEVSLMTVSVILIASWYINTFMSHSKTVKVPVWLSTPYVLSFQFSFFCILGAFNFNTYQAIWVVLYSTATFLLVLSFYLVRPTWQLTADINKKPPHKKQYPEDSFDTSVFSAMGHEMRTPLNGILGMSELLLSSQLTPKQQDYLKTLRYAGYELDNLISLLSEAWKLSEGQQKPDFTQYDINELLNASIDKFRFRAEQLETELISYVYPEVPEKSSGNARYLSFVIEGILNHMFSHAEQSEVMISINYTTLLQYSETVDYQRSESKPQLLFQISRKDRERPEPSPDVASIGSYSESRNESNINLHLYLAYQLVKAMGGYFGQIYQGSTHIWFAMPHDQEAHTAEEKSVKLHLNKKDKDIKALIVDDNKTCREVLAKQCALIGITTVEAENGKTALATIRNEQHLGRPFDVIILDHHMPGMNGIQMIERLNEEPISEQQKPKIIMLTGATSTPGAQRTKRLGISAFLTKPASRIMLQKALTKALTESEKSPIL